MRKETVILLKVGDEYYRFLTISFGKKDSSIYVYQHHLDETSSVQVGESLPLLKTRGEVELSGIEKQDIPEGDKFHVSIHPNCIHIRKYSSGSNVQQVTSTFTPQPFGENNFRLICLFTPPPPILMPKYDFTVPKRRHELIVFDWDNPRCPQVTFYGLRSEFTEAEVSRIPDVLVHKVLSNEGVPVALLCLGSTEGDLGVWAPASVTFGKAEKRLPISKAKLEKIVKANKLNIDLSSIPNNAIITDFELRR